MIISVLTVVFALSNALWGQNGGYSGDFIERAARHDKIQGVTISTHRIGLEWGEDPIGPTLNHISSVGANWVAIHPYALVGNDGSVSWDRFDPQQYSKSIQRPIKEAHARGLRILVKPHLAYWGSRFSWRGDIKFERTSDRKRFFRQYRDWIVHVAKLSRDADAFAVGCELDELVHEESEWRRIISEVRSNTHAALTYASNWPVFKRVPFWDALDAIGIQAYFPLSDSSRPTVRELRSAWRRWMKSLREFSIEQDRTIVFTELGYNQSLDAAKEPWAYRVDSGQEAKELKRRCLREALRAVNAEPSVVGAFLWKWFPEPRPNGATFRLADPPLKYLICEHWCLPPPFL